MSTAKTNPAPVGITQFPGINESQGMRLAPYLLGLCIDVIMCGFVLAQAIRFSSHAKSEHWILKVIVTWIVLAGLGYTVFLTWFSMHTFVFNFGDYAIFQQDNMIQWFIFLNAVIAIPVQLFYLHRTYTSLGNFKILLLAATPIVVLELGGAMAAAIIGASFSQTSSWLNRLRTSNLIWTGAQLVVDLLITTTAFYSLWRSKATWASGSFVSKFMIATTEGMVLPTIIATGLMIVWGAAPSSTSVIFVNLILSKPYIMGLLAVLNAKHADKQETDTTFASTDKNSYQLSSVKPQGATVHVVTETYTHTHTAPYAVGFGLNRQESDVDSDWKEGGAGDNALARTESGKTDGIDQTTNNSQTRLTELA